MVKILNPITISLLAIIVVINSIAPFFELNEVTRISLAAASFLLIAGIVIMRITLRKKR